MPSEIDQIDAEAAELFARFRALLDQLSANDKTALSIPTYSIPAADAVTPKDLG